MLLVFILLFSFKSFADCSNPGIDGVGTSVSTLNSDYYPGQGTANSGSTSITVGSSRLSSASINAGDLLLIIQMQDSTISYSNDSNYGSNSGTGKGQT
ncbi:MAG: hypothetical protein ACK4IX_16335, partial [Candidatus Sericytochromatia bacterium]